MFTVITGIIIAYVNYNLSAQEQMSVEHERSQERITLLKQIDEYTNTISNVSIKNVGSIDVILRAIYIDDDGVFSTFDPSVGMDTTLVPSGSIVIPIDIHPFKDAKIVAATQRGTRSTDIPPPIEYQEPPPPDTNEFYMGPLLLKFDEFWYQNFTGTFNPEGDWDEGWVVSSDPGDYCAWKIGLTNIGDKNITINGYSCFSTFPSGSSDYRSWFLWNETSPSTVQLPINETVTMFFVRASPESSGLVKIYSNNQICMVFLTFYGVYENGRPYAQTIPFEAAITIE